MVEEGYKNPRRLPADSGKICHKCEKEKATWVFTMMGSWIFCDACLEEWQKWCLENSGLDMRPFDEWEDEDD